jgi:hypothetical protein
MKKIFAIFGISLMIAGLACLSLLNLKIDTETEYARVDNSWTIPYENNSWTIFSGNISSTFPSWNFSKGDIMSIAIWPVYDWAVPPLAGEGLYLPPNSSQYFSADEVKTFQMNITNSRGNWAVIEVYYITTDPTSGVRPFSEYFGVLNHGALILDGGYPMPGDYKGKATVELGRVPQDGLYNVTCSMDPEMVFDQYINGSIWIHKVSPPSMMWLFRTTEKTPSPYLLVPIGAPIFVSGSVMTALWGVKRKKKLRDRKMVKYKILPHSNGLLQRQESARAKVLNPFREPRICLGNGLD